VCVVTGAGFANGSQWLIEILQHSGGIHFVDTTGPRRKEGRLAARDGPHADEPSNLKHP
jgi:hypothetical protein